MEFTQNLTDLQMVAVALAIFQRPLKAAGMYVVLLIARVERTQRRDWLFRDAEPCCGRSSRAARTARGSPPRTVIAAARRLDGRAGPLTPSARLDEGQYLIPPPR